MFIALLAIRYLLHESRHKLYIEFNNNLLKRSLSERKYVDIYVNVELGCRYIYTYTYIPKQHNNCRRDIQRSRFIFVLQNLFVFMCYRVCTMSLLYKRTVQYSRYTWYCTRQAQLYASQQLYEYESHSISLHCAEYISRGADVDTDTSTCCEVTLYKSTILFISIGKTGRLTSRRII